MVPQLRTSPRRVQRARRGFSIVEVVVACVVLSVMSLGILSSQISSARLVTEAREMGTADRLLSSTLGEVLLERVDTLCSDDTPFPFDTDLDVEATLLREPHCASRRRTGPRATRRRCASTSN